MWWSSLAALAVYYCQHGLQYLIASSPQDLFSCCILSSHHCSSANINLYVHAATAIPWCCLFPSNRLSCWSHHSHHGITHLYMDSSKCFLQCFHDCTHVVAPFLDVQSIDCKQGSRKLAVQPMVQAHFFTRYGETWKRYNFCFNNICWKLWRK